MKLSRRLIPAIAMLMVSAVLMSTASFAWFTMNSEVTAKGMQVTATAEGSLVIHGSQDRTTFSNVGTNAIDATLIPVTSFDGKNFGLPNGVDILAADKPDAEWEYEVETNVDGEEVTDEEGNVVKTFKSDNLTLKTKDDEGYVAVSSYDIKHLGGDAYVYVKDVKVTTKGDNTAKLLVTAVRVAIQLGDSDTILVFNPNSSSNVGGVVGQYDEESQTWTLAAKTYTTKGTDAVLGLLEESETSTQVHVYIWIEGQDVNCCSDQIDGNDYDVEVIFGATAVDSN